MSSLLVPPAPKDYSDCPEWELWQKAKRHAVDVSWKSENKKAYWDAQLAEIQAYQTFVFNQWSAEMEELRQAQVKMQDFFYEEIQKRDNNINLLTESVAALMKSERLRQQPKEQNDER